MAVLAAEGDERPFACIATNFSKGAASTAALSRSTCTVETHQLVVRAVDNLPTPDITELRLLR